MFRELRRRFLARHRRPGSWSLDAGSGPGRFTLDLGPEPGRIVAIDLSGEMLLGARRRFEESPAGTERPAALVRGDLAVPPFRPGGFGTVALLGNGLGFAGTLGGGMLDAVEQLVEPSGLLLIEIAPGSGERSRYLARLPPSTIGRLMAAPVPLLSARVSSEGFRGEPRRHVERGFRRWTAAEVHERFRREGWTVEETCAVAPCLGPDPERLAQVRAGTKAWDHLLELEEALGRRPERWPSAAAVLVAVRRPLGR